ncbi:MAG: MATE family efflux transporter [Clostridia bacterium]|nr:MATE family efflux transporter [Clostridia bacterium]
MMRGNDLGRDSVPKLVLRLAVPTMIAQFVNVLYSIIDRMYIGNIPENGAMALAGVGICGPIVTLLSSFGTLVGLGGSILMAMRMGEGDDKKAKQILSNSFLMLIAFSVVLTVMFLLLKNKLLMWFGASEATFSYADTYLSIYTAGTFFALMAVGLNYFINCQGFSTVGMTTVLIGAIANIVLDPIFIFAFDMGVAGAAVATVLSQMASCAFALVFLFGKRPKIKITFGGYSKNIMTRIITLGLSPFLILATDSIIIIVLNTVLQRTGGAEADMLIAAVTIVQSYMSVITGPMIGISSGTQAIISYNYGAGRTDRVKEAEKNILALCLVFTAIMFAVSRFVPELFAGMFIDDAEGIKLAGWGIRTFTLGIVTLSFQYVFVDGLTALGRTKTALTMSMFRKASYVVSAIVLAYTVSARASFYAEPLVDIVCSGITSLVFLRVFDGHLKKREMGFMAA